MVEVTVTNIFSNKTRIKVFENRDEAVKYYCAMQQVVGNFCFIKF